jgi:hypothetical protein
LEELYDYVVQIKGKNRSLAVVRVHILLPSLDDETGSGGHGFGCCEGGGGKSRVAETGELISACSRLKTLSVRNCGEVGSLHNDTPVKELRKSLAQATNPSSTQQNQYT